MLRRKTTYLASLTEHITPESTIIAFDLHNVVFKKQTRKILLQNIKLLHKGAWRYTFNPRLWYRFYKIRKDSSVAEDIFHKISLQYPGISRFRSDFIRMTNHQRPISSMLDIIKVLKEQGYALYILSNIGKETFEQLCEFYPALQECFIGAYTARADNDYLHKPHKGFYEGFKNYVTEQGHGGKQILFIDDLKKNLLAAAQCDIAGVHFTSPKRLLRAFKHLAVLP